MNVLVVGSGENARHVACELVAAGHQVAVLCEKRESIRILANLDFQGSVTEGRPTDLDSLRAAGIEDCDAIVSCTDDDNTNVMVAEMAREFFNTEKIVTGLVDVGRESIYQHYGLETICSTRLVADAIASALSPAEQQKQTVQFGTNTLGFELMYVDDLMEGRCADEIKLPSEQMAIGVMHSDRRISLLRGEKVKLAEGDYILIARLVD